MERRAARQRGPACDAAACGRRVWRAVHPQGGAVGRPAPLPGIFSEDGVSPPSQPAPMPRGRIAIMTMVYNERTNLPIWIRHYHRVAPSAALFVIDHASDDRSTGFLFGVN